MSLRFRSGFVVVALIMLGCAARPINPPITQANLETGYTFQTRQKHFKSQENLVILAFSGGGTRAAAFSYGVLEFLRRTEVVGPEGNTVRLLDAVDMITGVSGGSFTALAYGLYGEKLFDDYEQRFLKRDVEGELIARAPQSGHWGDLCRPAGAVRNWRPSCTTRSCSTARRSATSTAATARSSSRSATDISTGSRFPFNQNVFNLLCSDLDAIRCRARRRHRRRSRSCCLPSRSTTTAAPAATSFRRWAKAFIESANPPRPAARAIRELKEIAPYRTAATAPISISSTAACPTTSACAACWSWNCSRRCTPRAADPARPRAQDRRLRRQLAVVAAHRLGRVGAPPGTVDILLKATGVPIDRYSYEAVELLKDISARWETLRRIREPCRGAPPTRTRRSAPPYASRTPRSTRSTCRLPRCTDKAERDYLNELPTSFALTAEAVDRLRAAAGTIIRGVARISATAEGPRREQSSPIRPPTGAGSSYRLTLM